LPSHRRDGRGELSHVFVEALDRRLELLDVEPYIRLEDAGLKQAPRSLLQAALLLD
jgi:hypothetical protein